MTYSRESRFALRLVWPLLASTIFLLACVDGGSGGNTSVTPDPIANDPGPTDTPPKANQGMKNTVMLYVAFYSGSQTTSFPQYPGNISVTTDSQALLRYIPSADQLDVIRTNTSYSYASDSISVYTSADRLFINDEYSTQHTLEELDPVTGSVPRNITIFEAYRRGCEAVSGDRAFYQAKTRTDLFGNVSGGEFKSVDISGIVAGATTSLYAYNSANNCKGNLVATSTALFDSSYSSGTLNFYQRDPTTAAIIDTRTVYPTNYAQYGTPLVTFDGTIAYLARQRTSDQLIELYRYAMAPALASTQLTLIDTFSAPAGYSLSFLDADDGKIALASSAGTVVVYDTATGQADGYDFGVNIYNMQILYVN